jgi:hypothetical protein
MNSDKERILTTIANIIERSRANPDPSARLTRNLLLEYMNKRRPLYAQMSRDEFQNYFTTRPDRRTVIPAEDLVCLIEVILDVSPGSASAQEVLELCDAGRLPIREFRRLSRFFSAVEWNSAWKLYDAVKIGSVSDDIDFHDRMALVAQIHALFELNPIVCISGASGVGKTHTALKVCTYVESQNHRRVVAISGHHVVDVESFVVHVCMALRIVPLGNESLRHRLHAVVRTTPLFVFIDDLVGKTNDDMVGLLRHITQVIEHVQLLVTTVLPLSGSHLAMVQGVVVNSLTVDESILLFKQTCQQIGVFPRDTLILQGRIRKCEGNPLAIKLLAYSLSQGRNIVSNDLQVYRVLESLPELERCVVDLLVLFDSFVTVQFVKHMVFPAGASDGDVFTVIHALVRKGLLTVYEYNLLALHTVARVWYQHYWDYLQWTTIRHTFVQKLYELDASREHYDEMLLTDLHDWHNVMVLLDRVIKDGGTQLDMVVHALFVWRDTWMQLRLHQQVLLMCEYLRGLDFAPPTSTQFQLVYGSVLWRSGDITNACNVLTVLEVTCTLAQNMKFVGLCKIELSRAYATVGQLEVAQAYIRQAITIFEQLRLPDYRVGAYVYLVQLQIHAGQYHDASIACSMLDQMTTHVTGMHYADVLYMRAQVAIGTRKYALAHQYLNEAYVKYQQYLLIETHLWNVSIMKTLGSALEGQVHDVYMQLAQLTKKIAYFDNQQIVHLAECVAIYLMKNAQEHVAWQLMHVLVTHVPRQPQLYLVLGIEQYVEYMNMIRHWQPDITVRGDRHERDLWQILSMHIKHAFQLHASLVS